jgi:hypothetical protein
MLVNGLALTNGYETAHVSIGTQGPVWAQPVDGSHVSVVLKHPSSQLRGVPGAQAPPRQISLPLHTLPSSHEVPSGSVVPTQVPVAQVSLVVHAFPSLQGPVCETLEHEPVSESHESVVQGFPSSHVTGAC